MLAIAAPIMQKEFEGVIFQYLRGTSASAFGSCTLQRFAEFLNEIWNEERKYSAAMERIMKRLFCVSQNVSNIARFQPYLIINYVDS